MEFFRMMRMDVHTYDYILNRIAYLIQREYTPMRPFITPDQRLSLTLKYLATGK